MPNKAETIEKNKTHESDTGSPEVQIALRQQAGQGGQIGRLIHPDQEYYHLLAHYYLLSRRGHRLLQLTQMHYY